MLHSESIVKFNHSNIDIYKCINLHMYNNGQFVRNYMHTAFWIFVFKYNVQPEGINCYIEQNHPNIAPYFDVKYTFD